jgi:isocitrate/isopropylmalate dehydrogenase
VNGKRCYRIAAIGGDGIGPEVVDAGLAVLRDAADRDGFTLDAVGLRLSSNTGR